MVKAKRKGPQIFQRWEKEADWFVILNGRAQEFGIRICSEEMGAKEKPVQSSSYVARSNSFITPSESAILWFDVREAP